MLAVDELKELLHLAHLPGEERGQYQTLGGFVMMNLGRIPSTGDHFQWGGVRFEVVDMDGYRVDKVLAVPVPTDHAEGTNL
jgi:putative hemolysin